MSNSDLQKFINEDEIYEFDENNNPIQHRRS